MNLYKRLYNDICASIDSNVSFLKPKDCFLDRDIQNLWENFIDGGLTVKHTEDYQACFTFDYESNSKYKKFLSFSSYRGSAGVNLLDFIESVLNADSKTFKKIGNAEELCATFFKYEKALKRRNDIEEKNKEAENKVHALIQNYYDAFTIEEKEYLYRHFYDFSFGLNPHISSVKTTELEKNDLDEEIAESIDRKTDLLYLKYMQRKKMAFLQYYMEENPYDIELKEKAIQKLKL